MGDNRQVSYPEEDEDLEALRMAALQSLKRKNEATSPEKGHFGAPLRGRHKRGKFARTSQTRGGRNGQFNGWTRNSNLIAVPMISDDVTDKPQNSEVPKLVLPQHRYCNLDRSPEKSDNVASKFDRYDNSDQSESDSDESKSSKVELRRSDSLEALMMELENEIQGVKAEPKLKKKRRKVSLNIVEEGEKVEPLNSSEPNLKENLRPPDEPIAPSKPPSSPVKEPIRPQEAFPWPTFQPPPTVYPPMAFPFEPPTLFRPPSPVIVINGRGAEMAPLSPRSAAFVLENRAIVEKRRRRSWSRSPSPRFRRSKSPPARKLSLSPKRRSPSPKRRSLSPSSLSPPRGRKPPLHARLGTKGGGKEEAKPKEKKEEKEDPVLAARRRKFERNATITEGVIRLKKNEESAKRKEAAKKNEDLSTGNQEVTKRAEEESRQDERESQKVERESKFEEIVEEGLLEGDCEEDSLDSNKIEEIFSDEESDSDNEGRFKTKRERSAKITGVLPFVKLLNGAKNELKAEREARSERRRRRRSGQKRREVKPLVLGGERKIEIRIRNPAKYEKSGEKEGEKGRKVTEVKSDKEEVVEEERKEDATSSSNEGDLRAQLSRKRAERQKHPLPDVVPSRLLQNALQGVGFSKKKSKNDESAEGKLPIRLRLGSEAFGKRPRKRSKGGQEQV